MKKTIFFILGKSGSGKTTLVNSIMEVNQQLELGLHRIKLHTNRPQRTNEDESEYYFDKTPANELNHYDLFDAQFYTVKTEDGGTDMWYYYTSIDEFNNDNMFYIIQGPLVMYEAYKRKFGETMNIVPLYMVCDEKERLMRNIIRESNKFKPNWRELLRRLHEDETNFENLDNTITKDNPISIYTDDKPNLVLVQAIIAIQRYILNLYKEHKES